MHSCHKMYDMSSHGGHSHSGSERPCIATLSLETANELSWMLGERIVDDGQTTRTAEWRNARQSLTLFEATSETALLRYESPVGRTHYVGTTRAEAERARADLDASSQWTRIEK